MVEFTDDDLTGAKFVRVNLSGSRWHSVDFQNVRITDGWFENVDISAYVDKVVINDVDVTDFVSDELDQRHPERPLLRSTDVDGLRRAWSVIQEQATATVERARTLPAGALDESVDGEFSFVQTLRHLVYASDRWLTGPVFGEPQPFHRLGYPHEGADAAETAALEIDARPTLDEVLALRHERMDRLRGWLEAAANDDLQRTVPSPNEGTTSVLRCIQVVLNEEWEHNRYATRDLDVLARRFFQNR